MNEFTVVQYHGVDGSRPSLVRKERKLVHVVYIDSPITVRRIPIEETRYMKDLDYSSKKFARKLLSLGKTHGITKNARKQLRAFLKS